ncbi:hypothetical protein N7535_007472 [Penicillium sp. DV-2018c]|nr:hypothetical protein N7461_003499 [Penicillium sp. DV-2018c]KAJ5565834.1 hypothetical protein N7535_007472 [Penicillium sp. DV-2018c]
MATAVPTVNCRAPASACLTGSTAVPSRGVKDIQPGPAFRPTVRCIDLAAAAKDCSKSLGGCMLAKG